ncbi:MAG: DEAD/DEAH box helicase, partial [Chloroflexota bacterium]
VIVSDPWMPFEGVAHLLAARPEPVDSAFSITYNSYLNLIDSYGPDAAEEIVRRSFLMHQLSGQSGRLEQRLRAVQSELGALKIRFSPNAPHCYLGFKGNPLRQYDAAALSRARIGHEEKELELRGKKLARRGSEPVFQARSKAARERGQMLADQAHRLDWELKQSPCDGCLRIEEHRKDAQRIGSLTKEQEHLEHRLAQSERQLHARQGKELMVIRQTLEVLGYAGPERDADKASLLSGIFDESALQLAELIDRGELDRLEPDELAEVVSWFASADRQRPTQDRRLRRELTGRLRSLRMVVQELGEEIRLLEEEAGEAETEVVRPLYPNLVREWCDGVPFGSLCDKYEADEGDIASHISKSANLLRQLEKASTGHARYSPIHDKLMGARQLLAR